jgi:hypothetical protein
VVVSNDGCEDIQLNDYTISMYMNRHTEAVHGNKYQSLVLPVETIASGASFTICNHFASEWDSLASFASTCDFFTTGGYNGGLQHSGDDTIVLMKSGDTIDTTGQIGAYTACGSSSRYCKNQACVKTSTGAWGTSSWTCGLSKDVEPRQLSEFVGVGVSPSCDTEPTCSVTCSIDNSTLSVTHDTTSGHSTHKCHKDGTGCTCECA